MVEATWNWITGIPVAIWASVITGTITLAGVILGQYFLQRRQERQKQEELKALRDALAVELRAYDDILEPLLYATFDMEKFKEENYALTEEQYREAFESDTHAKLSFYTAIGDRRSISDEIYRSNANKIGELDSRTAQMVVQTYDILKEFDRSLESFASAFDIENVMAIDADVDWSSGAGLSSEIIFRKTDIEGTVAQAVVSQKLTLAYLDEEEIKKGDRALVAFAYKHMDPRSEQQEQTKRFIEQYMEKHDLSSPEEIVEEN